MKIKKFNAAVVGVVLVSVVAIYSFLGYAATKGSKMLTGGMSSGSSVVAVDDNNTDGDGMPWSAGDTQVTEVPWREFKGKIPGKLSLVKWETQDRIYYQMSGPINTKTIEASDYFDGDSDWGDNTEMEVFFERDGGNYDQWLINPANAQVLHWDDSRHFKGSSELPASRYSCEVKGGDVTTTFWVHKKDTPASIVFNYNYDNGGDASKTLGWATTEIRGAGDWNHHDQGRWTHP